MTKYVLSALALSATAMLISGCGGGASAQPTVRFLPSQPGGAAAASATASSAETPGPAAETTGSGGVGTLKGKVVYQGGDLKLPPLYAQGSAPKDPSVCGVHAIPDEAVVVNDGGLANVFIYLGKAPKGSYETPSEPVVFDQKNCIFMPHVLLARTGQPVKILNSDGALHNTHTYPIKNSPFNQGVQPNDTTGVNLVYTKAETKPFMVGCDVHPWMRAYHLPVDHPFAAVSGPDGTFEIKDLPAGKHEFKVWHEKAGELQKALAVTIKPNDVTTLEIPVPAAKLARFEGAAPSVLLLSSAGSETSKTSPLPK
jgi:hypothetical protein